MPISPISFYLPFITNFCYIEYYYRTYSISSRPRIRYALECALNFIGPDARDLNKNLFLSPPFIRDKSTKLREISEYKILNQFYKNINIYFQHLLQMEVHHWRPTSEYLRWGRTQMVPELLFHEFNKSWWYCPHPRNNYPPLILDRSQIVNLFHFLIPPYIELYPP